MNWDVKKKREKTDLRTWEGTKAEGVTMEHTKRKDSGSKLGAFIARKEPSKEAGDFTTAVSHMQRISGGSRRANATAKEE